MAGTLQREGLSPIAVPRVSPGEFPMEGVLSPAPSRELRGFYPFAQRVFYPSEEKLRWSITFPIRTPASVMNVLPGYPTGAEL